MTPRRRDFRKGESVSRQQATESPLPGLEDTWLSDLVSTPQHEGTLHRADGTTEQVPVEIPDGFWTAATDNLEPYRMSGWQNVDVDHPADTGHPGYRVAYKTLKLMPTQDIEMLWPNLRVRFAVGTLNRGGVRTPDGVPTREPQHRVVPEYGMRIQEPDGRARYVGCPDRRLTFSAWEENTSGVIYVEFIYRLRDDADTDADSVRRIGRAAVAPAKTILDLLHGPRLLGLPLLEEIGEVFEDWHWNRRLDSVALATELQLRPRVVDSATFLAQVQPAMGRNQAMTETDRARFRLASQWYWLADAQADPVNRFIQYWLVVESLEMPTTNISPVKARLAEIIGDSTGTASFVGIRGKLVHGNSSDVTTDELDRVRVLARVLLSSRIGNAMPADVERIRQWLSP